MRSVRWKVWSHRPLDQARSRARRLRPRRSIRMRRAMIKPWIFEFFRALVDPGILVPHPRQGVSPVEVAAQFANYWQRWIRAEEYGFEGIFFSEHHFGPGYSPSPNLLIAALAPATKRMRLGVMGVMLPY